MIFYVCNLLLLILYSFVFKWMHGNRKAYLLLSALHIGSILAFRSITVGTDTRSYSMLYQSVIESDLKSVFIKFSKYPGWAMIFKIISKIFGNNPNLYQLFSGYFIIIFIWISISLSDVDEKQSVILYYLFFALPSMNATRQHMAVGITFFSYVLLTKKKYLTGLLLIMCAISIHASSIIGIFLFLLTLIRWNKKRMWIVLAGTLFSIALLDSALAFFIYFFPDYNVYDLGTHQISGRNIVLQLIYIATFSYSLWISKKSILFDEQRQKFYRISLICGVEFILGIAGAQDVLIYREILYLQIFIIIFIPMVGGYLNRFRQLYHTLVYSMAFAYFGYRILFNYGDIVPYSTFF